MNYDDDSTRRTVEHCYRTSKTLVNPIIDWTEEDVWELIKVYRLDYCGLYDEGWKRLGCVGCPMGGSANQEREFIRWPEIERIYLHAFDEMIKARIENGMPCVWGSANEVMDWWLMRRKDRPLEGQITMFDEA